MWVILDSGDLTAEGAQQTNLSFNTCKHTLSLSLSLTHTLYIAMNQMIALLNKKKRTSVFFMLL